MYSLTKGGKRLGALVAILGIVAVAAVLRACGLLQPDAIIRCRAVHLKAAVGIFVLVYAITAYAALPTLPLNLAAGLFWGPWLGGILSTAGSTVGALAAFYSARILFDTLLARRYDNRLVAWVQSEFSEQGWRAIAFLRLNPAFPTGVLNYAIGLTAVDARTYTWATFCLLLPPSVAVALIGRVVGTFRLTGDVVYWIRRVILVCAAVAVLAGLRFAARVLGQCRRSSYENNSAGTDA